MAEYLTHQEGVFYHITKNESTWHENIHKIFNDVAWNML
jgi:hypothetical protein